MIGAKRVLVIEDEPEISHIIADILQDEGYKVTQVERATEAIKLLSSQEFDLITLDLRLPGGMDGNQFLAELTRLDGKLSNIPVIVVSANASMLRNHPQVREVINKPFNISYLSNTVQQWA
jgi:CheY-like chemotaxis protein